MHIEDQEALKGWLTTHLEPLCDADPAALAKYVLALIKKDKPVSELKDLMMQQMDVFLQAETQSFIDILFKVVETKEYEKAKSKEPSVDKSSNGDVKPSVEAAAAAEGEVEDKQPEADSTTPIREAASKEDEEKRRLAESDERRRVRRSPSPGRRRHNRSPPRRFRERSGSPRHDRFRTSRRGRSRSPPPPRYRGRPVDRSPPRHRPRSLDRSPVRRGNSRDSTPTRDEGGYNPTSKKIRCRDYDEKGFCLRGDLCKFDHGSDAVVLEDGSKPGVVGYQPGAPPPGSEAYVPLIPFPPPTIMSVPPPGYMPTVSQKRPYDSETGFEPPNKKFDFARLGRGRGGRGRGRGGRGGGGASRMLAVRNIPPELNNITHLNNHFCRFGNLQNIQVQFEGDLGSALVTFSTSDEANAAFTTPEAVMNNRFIKVYWHMDKGNVKERLGQSGNNQLVMVHGERLTKTLVNADAEGRGEDGESGEAIKDKKEKAILAIQKNQEMLQTKNELLKKAEEARREAVKQQDNLIKSKQDLLTKLIEQQKALISKVEKGKSSMKAEEKQTIMKLLKDLGTSIDRTKDDLKSILTVSSVKSKSRQEIQKELLDAEMELFSLQQDSGAETAEIQKKINMLRLEAAKNGLLPTSRPARGRGGYRGRGSLPRGGGGHYYMPRGGAVGGWRGGRGTARGRGFTLSPGSSTLDRRPSRILVSGYELEEKEDLIQHFQKFGEIVDILEDEATPSVIFKYKTRRLAETAMASGKVYGDRSLQLSWYTQQTPELEPDTQQFEEEERVPEDDDYTPPMHDYLPPGLQEHEDSLSQGSQGEEEAEADKGEEEEEEEEEEDHEVEEEEDDGEEINEGILDDEDEEEADEERSWKRRNVEED